MRSVADWGAEQLVQNSASGRSCHSWPAQPETSHPLRQGPLPRQAPHRASLLPSQRIPGDATGYDKRHLDDLHIYLEARLRQVSAKSKLAEAIR